MVEKKERQEMTKEWLGRNNMARKMNKKERTRKN